MKGTFVTPTPPPALVRYIREKRCVLFCGAGLSKWAKLPTWKELLQIMIKEIAAEIPDNRDLAELTKLIEAGKLLEVADHCKEKLGPRYYELMSNTVRGATEEIPAPHKVIVNVPFSAVVTTNYDKLLERSYATAGGFPKTPTHDDVEQLGPLLFDGSFFILKAHGDIDRPDTMVLTSRDFQNIIHANPAFNAMFSAILLTKAVFFVGYSLNDPDFRLLMDSQLTTFKGNVPERYALMSGVGPVERDLLWRTAQIRVVAYDDGRHEQVLEFLQALQAAIPDPEAAAPKNLAAALEVFKGLSRETVRHNLIAPPIGSVADRVQPAGLARPVAVGSLPLKSATLSIRLRGGLLEAVLASGDDAVQATVKPPDWRALSHLIADALKHLSKAKLLGKVLSFVLPPLVLDALRKVAEGELILLQLGTELELLPWEWLDLDGKLLTSRNPVARTPNSLSDSARGYPNVHSEVHSLLIGDPNQESSMALPGSLEETTAIANLYGERPGASCTVLVGADARFDRVAAELASGKYDVVHFSGHAWYDELEPYLLLNQGVNLRPGEFRSLLNPYPPAVVFLNSHFTLFKPPGSEDQGKNRLPGETSVVSGQRGFMEAAAVAGVGVLVGTFTDSLSVRTAAKVGLGFHASMLQGVPVAQALRGAMAAVVGKEDDVDHLTYGMSGYGGFVLAR
jgi:SIR2-like domain/CHAT domain